MFGKSRAKDQLLACTCSVDFISFLSSVTDFNTCDPNKTYLLQFRLN